MPDYITKIPARLSSAIAAILAAVSSAITAIFARLSSAMAAIFAWLSSLDHLTLSEIVAKLSFVDRLALIVVASQVVLLVLAILIEFSARKRRRFRTLESAAAQELAAARPEIPPAEEIAPLPSAHAPPAATLAEPVVEPAPVIEATPAIEVAPTEPVVEAAPAEPIAPPAVAVPPKAPARIGLGLRRTRENLLARIRAAITGSAKLDEICEGLEEALIAADVGVQASLKLVEAVRTGSRTAPARTLFVRRSRMRSRGCSRRANAR